MGRNDYSSTCQKIREYFVTKKEVLLVFLFGSFGTDKEHELSDIDIAVLLDKDISLMDELKMAADLSLILERDDLDLVLLRNASVNIAHRVLADGRTVFDRDPLKTAEFVESTLNHYFDFGYRLRQIDMEFEEKLREDYLYGKS
jgi:predicted nucleotidyltransferase